MTAKAFKVESPRSGFVIAIDAEEIGHAIAEAGGGRVRIEDQIDPRVGFLSDVKIGDELRSGDSIGSVFCDDSKRRAQAATRIRAAYQIGDAASGELPVLIKEVIDE